MSILLAMLGAKFLNATILTALLLAFWASARPGTKTTLFRTVRDQTGSTEVLPRQLCRLSASSGTKSTAFVAGSVLCGDCRACDCRGCQPHTYGLGRSTDDVPSWLISNADLGDKYKHTSSESTETVMFTFLCWCAEVFHVTTLGPITDLLGSSHAPPRSLGSRRNTSSQNKCDLQRSSVI